MTAFFQKNGVTSTRVGHTHLRKFISTQTHEQGTQDEGHTVERVMSHGATTKQRCYIRADLTATASKAMNIIEKSHQRQQRSHHFSAALSKNI